eukprot:scaffold630_cov188-Ochromonas_danica.AAC.13
MIIRLDPSSSSTAADALSSVLIWNTAPGSLTNRHAFGNLIQNQRHDFPYSHTFEAKVNLQLTPLQSEEWMAILSIAPEDLTSRQSPRVEVLEEVSQGPQKKTMESLELKSSSSITADSVSSDVKREGIRTTTADPAVVVEQRMQPPLTSSSSSLATKAVPSESVVSTTVSSRATATAPPDLRDSTNEEPILRRLASSFDDDDDDDDDAVQVKGYSQSSDRRQKAEEQQQPISRKQEHSQKHIDNIEEVDEYDISLMSPTPAISSSSSRHNRNTENNTKAFNKKGFLHNSFDDEESGPEDEIETLEDSSPLPAPSRISYKGYASPAVVTSKKAFFPGNDDEEKDDNVDDVSGMDIIARVSSNSYPPIQPVDSRKSSSKDASRQSTGQAEATVEAKSASSSVANSTAPGGTSSMRSFNDRRTDSLRSFMDDLNDDESEEDDVYLKPSSSFYSRGNRGTTSTVTAASATIKSQGKVVSSTPPPSSSAQLESDSESADDSFNVLKKRSMVVSSVGDAKTAQKPSTTSTSSRESKPIWEDGEKAKDDESDDQKHLPRAQPSSTKASGGDAWASSNNSSGPLAVVGSAGNVPSTSTSVSRGDSNKKGSTFSLTNIELESTTTTPNSSPLKKQKQYFDESDEEEGNEQGVVSKSRESLSSDLNRSSAGKSVVDSIDDGNNPISHGIDNNESESESHVAEGMAEVQDTANHSKKHKKGGSIPSAFKKMVFGAVKAFSHKEHRNESGQAQAQDEETVDSRSVGTNSQNLPNLSENVQTSKENGGVQTLQERGAILSSSIPLASGTLASRSSPTASPSLPTRTISNLTEESDPAASVESTHQRQGRGLFHRMKKALSRSPSIERKTDTPPPPIIHSDGFIATKGIGGSGLLRNDDISTGKYTRGLIGDSATPNVDEVNEKTRFEEMVNKLQASISDDTNNTESLPIPNNTVSNELAEVEKRPSIVPSVASTTSASGEIRVNSGVKIREEKEEVQSVGIAALTNPSNSSTPSDAALLGTTALVNSGNNSGGVNPTAMKRLSNPALKKAHSLSFLAGSTAHTANAFAAPSAVVTTPDQPTGISSVPAENLRFSTASSMSINQQSLKQAGGLNGRGLASLLRRELSSTPATSTQQLYRDSRSFSQQEIGSSLPSEMLRQLSLSSQSLSASAATRSSQSGMEQELLHRERDDRNIRTTTQRLEKLLLRSQTTSQLSKDLIELAKSKPFSDLDEEFMHQDKEDPKKSLSSNPVESSSPPSPPSKNIHPKVWQSMLEVQHRVWKPSASPVSPQRRQSNLLELDVLLRRSEAISWHLTDEQVDRMKALVEKNGKKDDASKAARKLDLRKKLSKKSEIFERFPLLPSPQDMSGDYHGVGTPFYPVDPLYGLRLLHPQLISSSSSRHFTSPETSCGKARGEIEDLVSRGLPLFSEVELALAVRLAGSLLKRGASRRSYHKRFLLLLANPHTNPNLGSNFHLINQWDFETKENGRGHLSHGNTSLAAASEAVELEYYVLEYQNCLPSAWGMVPIGYKRTFSVNRDLLAILSSSKKKKKGLEFKLIWRIESKQASSAQARDNTESAPVVTDSKDPSPFATTSTIQDQQSDVDDGEEIDSHDSDEESDDSDMPVRPNLLARQTGQSNSTAVSSVLAAGGSGNFQQKPEQQPEQPPQEGGGEEKKEEAPEKRGGRGGWVIGGVTYDASEIYEMTLQASTPNERLQWTQVLRGVAPSRVFVNTPSY